MKYVNITCGVNRCSFPFPRRKSLQSPFYFLVANIVTEDEPNTLLLPSQDYLSGSTVSSLYRLRDIDNSGKSQSSHKINAI